MAGFIDDFVGLNAYLPLPELLRRLDQPPTLSGAVLAVERDEQGEVTRRLERLPALASFSEPALDRQGFEDQVTNSFFWLSLILALFASVIAVGTVFNNARIALALRSRDLASLRILGFTRREISQLLLGEQSVQLLLGVAAGLPLGCLMGAATLANFPPEIFRVPAVFTARALLEAAAVVLGSGFACAWLVCREADSLDLVSVLKARD